MRAVVALAAASLILGAGHAGGTSMGQPVAAALPTYGYSIVRTYSHDPGAFTQGLEYLDGFLYESTGGYGRSTIRKVNLESGDVLQQASIPREHFAITRLLYPSELWMRAYYNVPPGRPLFPVRWSRHFCRLAYWGIRRTAG